MSNDSNDSNDTVAQAFQVGDRVRWTLNRVYDDRSLTFEGEVRDVTSSLIEVWEYDEGALRFVRPEILTLISRATPAPAATPPALELPVMVSCGTCNGHKTLHNDAWPDDTDYPEWVDCPECGGLGYHERTIRLTDDALNRLVGELANRLARVVRRSAELRI